MSELSAKKKKTLVIAGVAAAAIILLILIAFLFNSMNPPRTVASFCQVASEQKTNFKGSSSYQQRLDAFTKLNQVAPEDIRSETERIQLGYETIVGDSSKTIDTEMGIASSVMKVSDYIKNSCPNY